MDSSRLFFREIRSHKTSETLFRFLIFPILGRDQHKVNGLGTSPKNQFRDQFIWNRIEKLMPQHWNFSPQTKKTFEKTTNPFSNLDFLSKSGFPKNRDLSPAAPRGVYISRNDPPKKSENYRKHQRSSFVDKMATFCIIFLVWRHREE